MCGFLPEGAASQLAPSGLPHEPVPGVLKSQSLCGFSLSWLKGPLQIAPFLPGEPSRFLDVMGYKCS